MRKHFPNDLPLLHVVFYGLCGARAEPCPLALLSLLALTPLVLQVEDNRRYRLHKLTVQERVATSPYSNTRSVFLRRSLQQGRYVLIPTTYIPGVPTKFILRLYTDVPSKLRWVALTGAGDLLQPTGCSSVGTAWLSSSTSNSLAHVWPWRHQGHLWESPGLCMVRECLIGQINLGLLAFLVWLL